MHQSEIRNPQSTIRNSSVRRRDFLASLGGGFGALALAALMAEEAAGDIHKSKIRIDPINPLSARPPHFVPKAKNVIFLFMYGGFSHVDTLDYKPELTKLDGKPVPESIKQLTKDDRVGGVISHCSDKLLGSPWKFKQYGKSGMWISDLLPNIARHADDMCVLNSLHGESSNHGPATFELNTGAVLNGRPSVGSWVTYGLGSENQKLPGFVLLFDVAGFGGAANWSSGFLPASFQGTRFREQGEPVLNLDPPPELAGVQRSTIDLVQALNQKHRERRRGFLDLDARIASYELAYRMQAEALGVGDLRDESPNTLKMYGLDAPGTTAKYGRKCLMARRLVERGVRFVQVYNGIDGLGWDAHSDLKANHSANAQQVDQPIAALLTDLKQRGLLDSTLVIVAGEFGRTPMLQGGTGRNHNPLGYSAFLAGGGVRGGQTIGATDEIGLRAVVEPHSIPELHATILTSLGLNCDDLFFEHNGRPERLTGVAGSAKPIQKVFG